MKILVVEDDKTTREFVVKALTQQGFVVDSAGDGKEGLMMVISCEYQLVILYRMLPFLDGLKLLGAMRATGNNTPVIILSALDSVEQRVEGFTAGSDDYLTKPFALAVYIFKKYHQQQYFLKHSNAINHHSFYKFSYIDYHVCHKYLL